MSLSTFVEYPEVKEYLRLNVSKPLFQVRAELKAPPLTSSYGWTGTAFDYLLRFYIEKVNPTIAKARPWVAEESVTLLEGKVSPAALKRARGIVKAARDEHRTYLRSKREENLVMHL